MDLLARGADGELPDREAGLVSWKNAIILGVFTGGAVLFAYGLIRILIDMDREHGGRR